MTTLPDTDAVFWRLMEAIAQDGRPCLMNRMYQTPEERAGYAKHMAFMVAGTSHRQRLFMAGNRVGKAIKHGTLVATPGHWRPIEFIQVGDKVISGDDTACTVLGVYDQGEVDLFSVEFDGKHKIDCCGEHLWKTSLDDGMMRVSNTASLIEEMERGENIWCPALAEIYGSPIALITLITPAGRAQATCIEVDHPSHTYVIEHGIVTHNTEGAGGYELALHLTGRYPDWWQGRRFDKPVIAWAAGDTRETTRDILQAKIIGQRGKLQECKALVHPSYIAGTNAGFIPDSFSSVKVRHISGELSVVHFKSYDQGREAFQGTEVDVILLDEEPPLNVYLECLTRTMTNNGMVMLTFTPLRGMSETVQSFFPDGDVSEGVINGRHVTMAGWDDAPHLTEEAKQEMLATYPPFMRLARSRGLPQMGAGVIYPVDQSSYVVEPFSLPESWRRVYGMDVGWNRTAALWFAIDDESGTWWAYNEHYMSEATPLENSHGIKGRGDWIPGVIDPASRGRNQKDGTRLIDEYMALGLDLTVADNSVDAGIHRVWTMLISGKLKVFSSCQNFLREMRGYIRDEKGKIVKENDHLCDCCRYALASGDDVARTKPLPMTRRQNKNWVA